MVVYLLVPTSNHNFEGAPVSGLTVVYLLVPTSNHNVLPLSSDELLVVYLLVPTSNHNVLAEQIEAKLLYTKVSHTDKLAVLEALK